MWAINTTFHTTLKASPAQLALNRDMFLPTSFAASWYAINNHKQTQLQSTADAKNRKRIPHEFCINDKFSSVVTLAIHIWVNSPSLLEVLSRLSMYNDSQSMVPFLYSDHRLLLSASTFADCCHFLNVTIEDVNVVPQSL
jgi:hypothetical protein